jgi:hypothetical protein
MPVVIQKEIPKLGIKAHFVPRHAMKARGAFREFKHTGPIVPPTVLPVDSTGNATVSCPMDGNDALGICGPAMAMHIDNIWTFGQGKPGYTESVCNLPALEAQYEQISGGDNGTDEAMLVGSGGIWRTGLAGNPQMIIVDALDIDVTNIPLTQFAIDQFYAVCMAWSVPDAFIDGFEEGSVWSAAAIPDPNNGHYVPLADVGGPSSVQGGVSVNGFYRLWTWGTWCWAGPAFIASVQPQTFVAFSPRQFSPTTGLDSKGRHIVTQASKWGSVGGAAIAPAVLNAFPPLIGPTPPTPQPPAGSKTFTFAWDGKATTFSGTVH